jgi:hypothetical protein
MAARVGALRGGRPLLGDLRDARNAWRQVEAAYAVGPYAGMREALAL